MKKMTSLITLIITSLALPAFAQVTLSLPKNSELLVVNGKPIEAQSVITLPNGSNQVLFKYHTSFRQQGQQRRFTSEAIILTFKGQNSAYKLTFPKLRSERDADKFIQSPSLTLIDEKGADTQFVADQLFKEGIQLGRDYDKELAIYNKSNAPAALGRLANKEQITAAVLLPAATMTSPQVTNTLDTEQTVTQTAMDQAPVNDSKAQINVGQMLDFWYSQADAETRRVFRQKIDKIEQ